ncbi:MinD/ParA family ATP-binding protein [Brachybacterium sp. DNPG3]
MIAQARITSDTSATVHLASDRVELTGSDLPDLRTQVKQVFIDAARTGGQSIDVVIVEPDIQHHLRVEPTGRITGRTPDQRPLYGPSSDVPLSPASAAAAGAAGAAAVPGSYSAGSPLTGELTAIGSPATGELPTVRPHRARRRRAAALPPAGQGGGAGDEGGDAAGSSTSSSSTSSSGSAGTDWEPSDDSSTASSSTSSSAASSSAASASAPSAAPAAAASRPDLPSAASLAASTSPARSERSGGTGTTPSPAPRPTTEAPLDSTRPTLQDLQRSTTQPSKVVAHRGWRSSLRKMTGGAIKLKPGRKERTDNEILDRVRRPLEGPRNIAVVNLKGGAHKTTASLMIAATLGVTRGGNVLAWDNNETRGTLGWRGVPTDHHRTAVDLLHDIDLLRAPEASAADLDTYVRSQGAMRFDILASDEDPGSAALIDAEAFGDLNDALSRFYRIKVIDTGNNVRASNWLAAVRNADQLVIISTVREDTFNAAAWMIDELRATGLAEQVDHAVTVLSHSSKGKFDPVLRKRLLAHFGAHTRAVCEVPFEQQFVDGSHLDWARVSPQTKKAWLAATATIIDGL